MSEIDFAKIRSAPKSRNDSFESLAVQLFAASIDVPADSTFVSLRGEGGDGGVEAFYRTPIGEVLGVQAKYFFRLSSSELGQIDSSLKTAISNHPSLSQYWVYVPFDLTGRVAVGKRGKSEAERFEEWKSNMERECAERGFTLSITLCTAAVIRRQLLERDKHGGMRRYWFDDSMLTTTQIEQDLNQAMAFAGPRYSSALDVVTNAHAGLDFFGEIGDFQAWRDEALAPVLKELRSLKGWGNDALNILGEPQVTTARALVDRAIVVCDGISNISTAISALETAKPTLAELIPLLDAAREAQEDAFYAKHGKSCDTPGFRQFHAEYMCDFPAGEMDAARKWAELCLRILEALSSPELGAATTRSLLLIGPAGIGKTHAIVSAALRRLTRGGLSLVVFGDDFGRGEPWEVLRSKLGFGSSIGREALFEILEASAENTGLPFVIYVDALNESPREARWKDKLPELLAQCKPYPGIKICVSTRDTYRHLVVDSRFPGLAFEHVGFAGKEFEALQAFATFYGLDSEITPLFAAELANPLFLHLACRTLQSEGRHSLDVSLPGFTALFESHLQHSDELVRERLHYANPNNLVRAAMLCLAETLTHSLPEKRTWKACIDSIKEIIGSELAPEKMLQQLEHEGLVILTAGDGGEWLVRLGYQRYGDVLRAASLVESCIATQGLDIAALANKLATLTAEDDGLCEVLAAVLPEKTGIEITLSELGLEPARAHQLFIQALAWRSRASFSATTIDCVYDALKTPGLWPEVFEAFFRLSLIPEHLLNARNWLNEFLQRQSMVNRDAYLSVAAYESFDSNGAVRALINATLRADISHWPVESCRLAAISLAWLTSCADRRVRDMASKALARIVGSQPEIGKELTEEFQCCDDDYVLERISLAIYSACLLERSCRREFLPALAGLLSLSPASSIPNVLIRDSVRLLGRLLATEDKPAYVRRLLESYPRKVTTPAFWPKLTDAKPLLSLEHLPSNMELWGQQMSPDFWRYQVESKISHFDLGAAGISNENVACWIMLETLNLGYPGFENVALRADRNISAEFGSGRGRKGYAERLGKKYYWISLHRILGVLSDNVPPKVSYSDRPLSITRFWSVDVRKVDLTDIRDISPLGEYPHSVLDWPPYVFPERNSDIKQWVRQGSFPPHQDCVIRAVDSGEQWVALSLDSQDDDKPSNDDGWHEPYLGARLYYSSIFVDSTALETGIDKALTDAFDSSGAHCYRGYFAEYPDGPVYDQFSEEGYFYSGPEGMTLSEVTLLRGSEWEYDYSSEESQENLSVPCQDLVRQLNLNWDKQRGWVDSTGRLVAFEAQAKRKRRSGLFIKREDLNIYLKRTGKRLVYRQFGNRGLFDQSGTGGAQIDLFTWLQYESSAAPSVLKEVVRTFSC